MAVTALILSANVASAQLKVGVGYANDAFVSKVVTTAGGETATKKITDNMNGFNVSALYSFDFLQGKWGSVGMEAGLQYGFLGKTEKSDNDEYVWLKGTVASSYTEHDLDIPVLFKYGYDFVPDIFGAYIFAGPTFSFGLSSTIKTSCNGTNPLDNDAKISGAVISHNYSGKVTYTGNIKDFFQETEAVESGYSWFDVKLGLGVGFEVLEMLDLKVGYNWGLLNRFTGGDIEILGTTTKYTRHSNQFYVGLSYMF